ncbi:hypothetical protein HYPSUDRAFT_32065 [Hypholoma sublateritium FD-334 SS-4]|uniref:TLC domain-containing protein n=1 Tax=Hypholoma sublateritium (strain FD-334 SS-4) TaxID=945553 RepID=A0A0D2PPB4_HYPSF|nr:hypothetical protein HYPSUDRAFT_32065 [Hypholoma sublateritium FD-334 SS-4]
MDIFNAWSTYIAPFYSLQYPTATPQNTDSFHDASYYIVGPLDICFVISCIAVMAILRDALRLGFFEPLARWKLHRDLSGRIKLRTKAASASNANGHAVSNGNGHAIVNGNGTANGKANGSANGHASVIAAASPTTRELRQLNRKVIRFAEQGWSVVYYSIQWSFGIYIHFKLPTRVLDPIDLWLGYPHIPISSAVKLYYLTQLAFYLHQILILNAEARRKDHYQMMSHHVITIVLVLASYITHFTRAGCVIMALMDCCDIFLPLGKMSLYLDYPQMVSDGIFGVFMLSWFITRHILFPIVIWSTATVGPKYINFRWDWEGGFYVTKAAFTGYWIMLLFLQALQIIWFGMIIRVATRVATGKGGASDVRSDAEDSISDKKEN